MAKSRVLLTDLPSLDRFVLDPLRREGYNYVDELQNLPMPTLCEIVSGPKSQYKIARVLGREEEWRRFAGKFDIEIDGELISGGQLKQYAGLAGTARAILGNREASATDLHQAIKDGIVTWEQVARYVLDQKRAKRELIEKSVKEQPRKPGVSVPVEPLMESIGLGSVEQEVTDLVEQYKRDYDVTQWTGADWAAVKRLAMLEIYANRTQALLLNQGQLSSFQYAPQLKALSDQVKTTNDSIARMREDMGISLKARAESDRAQEAHDALREFASEVKELVARRSSVLIHCGVRLGLVLPHFPRGLRVEGRVVQVCPVCGVEVEWSLVTQEMLDTYVEAGDFVPRDAPPGAFEPGNERDMTSARHTIERDKYHSAIGI